MGHRCYLSPIRKLERRKWKSVKYLPYLMGVLALRIFLSKTMSLDIPQMRKLPGNRLKCCKKDKISFSNKEGSVIKVKPELQICKELFLNKFPNLRFFFQSALSQALQRIFFSFNTYGVKTNIKEVFEHSMFSKCSLQLSLVFAWKLCLSFFQIVEFFMGTKMPFQLEDVG